MIKTTYNNGKKIKFYPMEEKNKDENIDIQINIIKISDDFKKGKISLKEYLRVMKGGIKENDN